MILSIAVLTLLIIQASPIPQEDASALLKYDELYYNIVIGRYVSAARITMELKNEGRGEVIRLVVNKLLAESKRNVVDYAYKLVRKGEIGIVRDYFPIHFRWILLGEQVKFINLRDANALKLEWGTDRDGDRGAYGDKNEWESDRMSWKIIPHWWNQRAYFEIVNKQFGQYLKLESNSDSDGEHKAFGGHEHDTWRHLWYFHPVVVGSETVFFIFNRNYNQALKLGRYVDGDGDRRGWGHNGGVLDNPAHYAWYVRPHNS